MDPLGTFVILFINHVHSHLYLLVRQIKLYNVISLNINFMILNVIRLAAHKVGHNSHIKLEYPQAYTYIVPEE